LEKTNSFSTFAFAYNILFPALLRTVIFLSGRIRVKIVGK